MFESTPLEYFLILSAIIFTIGAVGVLTRRNAIIIFMSIEMMLNAVNLTLVSFSQFMGDTAGQIFVFFVMAVAAAEAAGSRRRSGYRFGSLSKQANGVGKRREYLEVVNR